jgi:hypothetical protein
MAFPLKIIPTTRWRIFMKVEAVVKTDPMEKKAL